MVKHVRWAIKSKKFRPNNIYGKDFENWCDDRDRVKIRIRNFFESFIKGEIEKQKR